jgi:dienelactone hydrolase
MAVENVTYSAGGKTFISQLVYDEKIKEKRPLLLVSPNWLGVSAESISRTQTMVDSRYIGLVADMYGDGRVSMGPREAAELADGVRADPKERRLRISAAMSALIEESERRKIGDSSRKAAVGFCFGGGNVLELARTGANLNAVVCVHGELATPLPTKAGDIKAALLVLHGAADPVAPKAQRDAFEAEMEAAQVNWQMLTFGHALHSFCEPESNVPGIARYDEAIARQSYRLIDNFVDDAFQGKL